MRFNEEMMEAKTRQMCEEPFWKQVYDGAPEMAKKRLRVAFWASKGGLDEREDLDAYREFRESVEAEMTLEDVSYLAENFPEGAGKKHYLEMCRELQFSTLKTREKLDEAIDIMIRWMPEEDAEKIRRSREAFRNCEEPWIKYSWLWEAVGGKGDQCCMVGDIFDHGHGVERNAELAEFWFKKGALCGDGDSCCRVAALYEDEEESCFDFALANFWYREALRRNNLMVKWMLGCRLTFGKGAWVEAQNPKLGVEILKSGLELDFDGDCQYHLGRCYEEGVGVEKNRAEAIRLYKKAAEYKHRGAEEALKRLNPEPMPDPEF